MPYTLHLRNFRPGVGAIPISTPVTHEIGPDVVIGELSPGAWQTAEIYSTTRIAYFPPDGPEYATPPNVTGEGPGGDTGNLWDRAATEAGWWECGGAYIRLTTILGSPGGFVLGVLDEAGATIVEHGGSYAAGVGTATDNVYIVSAPAHEVYAAQPGTVTDAYKANNVSLLIGSAPDWTSWLSSAAEYTPPTPDPDPETPGCDSNPLSTLGSYTSFYEVNFVTPFVPTQQQINEFISQIYTTSIFDEIAKYFGNPGDAIAGLYVLPVPRENLEGDTDLNAQIALRKIPVNMRVAKSNTYRVSFGIIQFPEKINGGYLDYAPYTQAQIYIPYAGTYSLDVDRIHGRYLALFADLDILTGAAVYHLTASAEDTGDASRWQLIAEYDAQTARQLPYSAETMRSTTAGITRVIQGAAPLAAAAGVGAAAAAAAPTAAAALAIEGTTRKNVLAGAVYAGSSTLTQIPDIGANVRVGGTPSPFSGQLMTQRPYIIITRPERLASPSNLIGLPAAEFGSLSALSGYAEVTDLQITGARAEDVTEISAALASGVFF